MIDEIFASKGSSRGSALVENINEIIDATIEAHRSHITTLEDLTKKLHNPREENINLIVD